MIPWIKIETSLPRKPEVMQLADILGIDEFAVVGHLVCFWSWVDENVSQECPAVNGTKRGLDRVAGRDGFAAAMVAVGWLQMDGNEISIPHLDYHLDHSAKTRATEQRKKAKQRAKPSVSRTCPDADGTTSGTAQGQKGGPEKRREEKSIVVIPESARPLQATPETQEPQQPQSPEAPLATLPATIPRPSFRRPTAQDVAEYATGMCLEIDPQAFHDYYAANGWRIGRNAMKDWKAAARNWAKRDRDHAAAVNAGMQARGSALSTFQRETPFERNQRNEQQQLQLLADMCALAEEQNARHAAEQQARDAGSGVLGYADPGAHHR
jgi:hypothetical protein